MQLNGVNSSKQYPAGRHMYSGILCMRPELACASSTLQECYSGTLSRSPQLLAHATRQQTNLGL